MHKAKQNHGTEIKWHHFRIVLYVTMSEPMCKTDWLIDTTLYHLVSTNQSGLHISFTIGYRERTWFHKSVKYIIVPFKPNVIFSMQLYFLNNNRSPSERDWHYPWLKAWVFPYWNDDKIYHIFQMEHLSIRYHPKLDTWRKHKIVSYNIEGNIPPHKKCIMPTAQHLIGK